MSIQTRERHLADQHSKWLTNAGNLLNSEQFPKARKLARRLLRQAPDNDSATFILAICEEQAGKLPKAITLCRSAIRQAPQNRDYRCKLAHLLLTGDELDEAEELFAQLCGEDRADVEVLLGLAKLYHRKGETLAEYIYLCRLKHLSALPDGAQPLIVDTLTKIPGLPKYPELEDDLHDFLDYTDIDLDKLTGKISRFLCGKYHLGDADNSLELSDLLRDRLLNKALRRVAFISPEIEELLTKLRHALLTEIASSQVVSAQLAPLLEAIALQNHINDYVHYISAGEQEILNVFSQFLTVQGKGPDWSPRKSEVALLCLAMYGQLYDLPERDRLLEQPPANWPDSLRTIAGVALFDIDREIREAAEIPNLTAIEDETSMAVRSQYEANPYPRWIRPTRQVLEIYGNYMAAILPDYRPPKRLRQRDIKLLIAGCGTGMQPIQEAISYPRARITAVDISRRSLAYARRKAEEFGVNNIEFQHGDILKLGEIGQRFDLIFCSGVLHHMAEPVDGWRVLRDLLTPEGILRIDLYSQIARREISRQREIIAGLKMEPTPENIRRYRQALLDDKAHGAILDFRDFWKLSSCRDLLFHYREHQFTWPRIGQCCDDLDMEFVGVHADKKIYRAYKTAFPHDTRCRNLEDWHQLELLNPGFFRCMYAFWCTRK